LSYTVLKYFSRSSFKDFFDLSTHCLRVGGDFFKWMSNKVWIKFVFKKDLKNTFKKVIVLLQILQPHRMYVFYFLRCLLALICSVCELYFYQVITLFKMGLRVETSVANRTCLHNLDYSVYHFKLFRLMQLLFSRAWGERWARTSPGWLWPSRSSARACLLEGQLIYLPQRPCTLFYSPTVLGEDFDFTMTDFCKLIFKSQNGSL